MSDKKRTARHIDAASIIGEDLATDLEAKSQELVGRSGPQADPAALILKDAAGFPPASEGEDPSMASGTSSDNQDTMEGEPMMKSAYFGGAVTLSQAEANLVRERGENVLLGDWELLAGVLTNIAGPEHGPAIAKQVGEFQSRLDIMAVKALANLQPREVQMAQGNSGVPTQAEDAEVVAAAEIEERDFAKMTDEQKACMSKELKANGGDMAAARKACMDQAPVAKDVDVLEEAMLELRTAYDEALETPVDTQSRLRMIQPAMQSLGDVIRTTVDVKSKEAGPVAGSAGGFSLEQLQAVVAAAVAPLAADIEAMKTRNVADAPRIPARRARVIGGVRPSYAGPVPGATGRIADEFESASAMRGVGAGFDQPSVINPLNDTVPASETPKLQAMIRRSVVGNR